MRLLQTKLPFTAVSLSGGVKAYNSASTQVLGIGEMLMKKFLSNIPKLPEGILPFDEYVREAETDCTSDLLMAKTSNKSPTSLKSMSLSHLHQMSSLST
jgi:hypothetical protein